MLKLELFQRELSNNVCVGMKLSRWNLQATKLIKQNHSRTKLFIIEEHDLSLFDLHFHKH